MNKTRETLEYRNAWTKQLIGKDLLAEERSLLAAAGSVIPALTAQTVWDRLVDPADLLAKVDITRFPHYAKYPVTTTNNDATAQAVGSSVSASSDVIGGLELTPVEYIKTLGITADIMNANVEAMHDWLTNGLAAKISEKLNADILIGSGTNELTGIAEDVDADASALPDTLTLDSLLGVMKALGHAYRKGAIWIMTPDLFFENVLAIEGIGTFLQSDGFDYRLIGHDVVLMPEAEISGAENIFFGDPLSYKLNFFSDFVFRLYESAEDTTTTWKASVLVNGGLLDTSAFVRFAQS